MDNKMLVDHDINAEDLSNSENESENDNEALESRAEELERLISDNKYAYDAHVELVGIYKTLLDLKSMREAYQRFASYFPLTEKLWLDWIKTEISVATNHAEKANILSLFKTAVKDYLSVALWLEYVQFCIGFCSLEETRNIFEAAVATAGMHISQGSLIWDAYREFELVHLSLLSDKTTPEWQEQANRINECFKRQLSVPLLNTENTYAELDVWIKNSEKPEATVNKTAIEWAYKNSCKLLDIYRKHENELLVNADHATMYQNYIKDIKQPTHVICLYERSVAELSLNHEIWLQYCEYLQKLNMPVEEVVQRALRNCPWCEELWVFYIRQMEQEQKEFEQITSKLEAGLVSIIPNRGLQLWLSYLEYSYRNKNVTIDQLNQIFEQAQLHLGNEGDPQATIPRFHARILGNKGDMVSARKIWNEILKHSHRGMATAWLEFATFERLKGTPEELRHIFQKAVTAVKDWPQSICDEWMMYERECGTLDTMLKCINKCKSVPKLVSTVQSESEETNSTTNKSIINGKRKHDDNKKTEIPEKRKRTFHQDENDREDSKSKQERLQKNEEGKFAYLLKKKTDSASQADTKDPLDPDRTVFISNMSSYVDEERLQTIFPNAEKIILNRDPLGKSRGHGCVQFKEICEVQEALERDREPIEGRPMFVSRFRPAREDRQYAFSKGKEENKLFVKGLPYSITQEQLEDVFKKYGQVKVRQVLKHNGRPKGLAYVEYSTKEEAATALKETDNMDIDNCTISVAISAPPTKSSGGFNDTRFSSNFPRHSKSRLQVPLIPRVLSSKVSSDPAKNANTSAAGTASVVSSKSNQDFRNMLLGKK